ncbi:MAG: response regulator transcription factor [Psychromonas sp.]
MTDKVLLVEDDVDIAGLLKIHLHEMALQVFHSATGAEAMQAFAEHSPDLVILDLMLPDASGLDLCQQFKQRNPLQAVLMLTARNSEVDRIVGLELGADDYMGKPFSGRELQARVRALLRRVNVVKQSQITANNVGKNQSLDVSIGQLQLDKGKRLALYFNKELDLTATEFDLLYFLLEKPEHVFSRAQLLEQVWGYHHECYEHTVNSHVNRLRQKIEKDPAKPKIIETVWGVGYKLNPKGVSL